jgi:hypothetical protein
VCLDGKGRGKRVTTPIVTVEEGRWTVWLTLGPRQVQRFECVSEEQARRLEALLRLPPVEPRRNTARVEPRRPGWFNRLASGWRDRVNSMPSGYGLSVD